VRIRTQCRSCGLPFRTRLTRQQEVVLCPNCGEERPVDTAGWPREAPHHVVNCLLCGCRHLYRQRDVNRALGCLLVAIGAVLVPWTYGLSLVVLAGVDLILFYRLRESVVCYRCDTVYRDARPGPRQNEFDLLKHDVLKYGKSWAEPEGLSGDEVDDSR
jgi:hypothetical protein